MAQAIALQPLVQANILPLQKKGMLGFCLNQRGLFKQYAANSFCYSTFARRTDRATQPLQSAYDMLCYNALYAPSHYTLFNNLLNHADFSLCKKPLTVFDYGCGQGLATLNLLEKLRHYPAAIDLHLVELSQPALYAAERYAQSYAKANGIQLTIHSHNQSIDSLENALFDTQTDALTLHLFSNVLDIAGSTYNLDTLLKQIHAMPGTHICFASGPRYANTIDGAQQLINGLPTTYARTQIYNAILPTPYHAGYFSCTHKKRNNISSYSVIHRFHHV